MFVSTMIRFGAWVGKRGLGVAGELSIFGKNRPLLAGTFIALLGPACGETITNSIGMRMVRIEAGSFIMGQDGPGSGSSDDEASGEV